jgi:hypothetical protein
VLHDGNIKRKNNIFLEEILLILLAIDRFMGMNCLGKTTWMFAIRGGMTGKIHTEVGCKQASVQNLV